MKQSLNFRWSYLDHFKKEYLKGLPKEVKTIDIPHNICNVPYNYFDEKCYQKIVTYEKVFDVKDKLEGKIAFLQFDGFMLQADIYLNDNYLGHFISGYLPVRINVSEYIKQKDNRLLVILDSREDKNIPPFGYAVDYLTFSGIYREVFLITHERTYLDNIYVRGDMKGDVNVDFEIKGDDPLLLKYEILGEDDKPLVTSDQKSLHLFEPHLWEINSPYLYTLRITASTVDFHEEYRIRFGFRDVIFKENGFYLNNKLVHLIGLNRHQLYPFVGGAMPKSMQYEDAKLLKEIGVNVVRCSHYPQSDHFLNACDELGLLYINEVPGWQHISKEETWRNNYYDFIKRMVLKERNHPSLIAYGVRIDESIDDHELYQKGNGIAHELDPYRQTLGVRNFKNSELLEDIYAYNDFVCENMKRGVINPKKAKKGHSPYLITEYMGHMEPLKSTSDINKAQETALRHLRVIDDSYKYKRISGCIGWCFVDYYTHVDFGSGDHICTHGVLDMFRNKKYSSYSYETGQDEHPFLKVLSNMKPGDFAGASYKDIYVFTNCDYIELYKNDEFVARFYPNHKEFKYLKHPPIKIDDILGETFKVDKLNDKENKRFAKIFSYGGMYGYDKLKLFDKLYVLKTCMKYHLGWSDLLTIWNNEVATWGGYAKTFTFKGFINNNEVIKQIIAPYSNFKYEFKMDRDYLKNEDTYDVLSIHISLKDVNGDLMNYAERSMMIETTGPIELINPKYQSLIGGQITIYVKSLNKKGGAQLIIHLPEMDKVIDLKVK